jgi:ElaB/YqjD/DUF883 family membrane-anchored ribosome-binding protein
MALFQLSCHLHNAQEIQMATTKAPPFDDISSQTRTRGSGVEQMPGEMPGDTMDEKRRTAAGGLDSAAETLHQKADRMPGGEKAARAAHTAADALSSTAEYIREHDVKSMVADMQDVVRRNPGPALLVAAAVGFLFARTFSRD